MAIAVPDTRTRGRVDARRVARDVQTRTRAGRLGAWTAPALGLFGIVILLTVVGLVFVGSASSVTSLHKYGNSWYYFRRQLRWAAFGSIAMALTTYISYRRWQRLAVVVLVVSVLGTLATFSPLGITKNGSARWIGPSSFAIQPSEILKFAVAVSLAALFTFRVDVIDDFQTSIKPALILLLVTVGPVFLQPDMGTAMILLITAASLFAVSGMSARRLGSLAGAGVVLTLFLAWIEPYRRDRLLAFLHPTQDVSGIGYHVFQSKLGFSGGRLFGVGVGASRAKWGFLPNSFTDFIFAIIGEELGLIGAALVLGLFLAIAVIGLLAAGRAPDRFGMLLATGITTWIVAQAIINMGAVIGTMPVTGVPLPFISAGGSSFVVVMGAVGVLVNIARQGIRPERRASATA